MQEHGVDENTIEKMCIDDRADFNSNRRFYHWTSDFGEYLEGMADREQNTEVKTVTDLLDEIEDQTEFVLAFKKGRFPQPRGAGNIKQMVAVPRGKHSEKPLEVIDGITKMFPEQDKIELFARNNFNGWDNWGLEIPDSKIDIITGIDNEDASEESDGQIIMKF